MKLKQKPIDNPDITNESIKYWDKVLSSHDLSIKRADQPNKVRPIGGMKNIEILQQKLIRKEIGIVDPEGYAPDS